LHENFRPKWSSVKSIPVEVDGLSILFGDLFGASRQFFALFLGKFFHFDAQTFV
jgi:hypothetical protein